MSNNQLTKLSSLKTTVCTLIVNFSLWGKSNSFFFSFSLLR